MNRRGRERELKGKRRDLLKGDHDLVTIIMMMMVMMKVMMMKEEKEVVYPKKLSPKFT